MAEQPNPQPHPIPLLPEKPLSGTSQSFPGVQGKSNSGPGVEGISLGPATGGPATGPIGDGVYGIGANGVHGQAALGTGNGVLGENDLNGSGCGVMGTSVGGSGVKGTSTGFDAVVGETSSNAHAGVTGRNTTTGANGGVGVYGVGGQYAGKFDGALLVNQGTLNANNDTGWAVQATSKTQDAINATSSSPQHAGVSANNTGGGFGVWAQAKTAGQFNGNVNVNGTLTVSTDIILTGADCAEEFDIARDHAIEPGTVMILDEAGSLRASDRAYDRKVAGVISGGGEYKPGLILDRGNSSQKRLPLALVGKVYCKVDTQFGAIGIGDLLTTSPTPGHAMKAENPLEAFGATIGKALESMSVGQKGLIPILVSLQ
jgi:hypothetical protein